MSYQWKYSLAVLSKAGVMLSCLISSFMSSNRTHFFKNISKIAKACKRLNKVTDHSCLTLWLITPRD